MLRNGGCAVAPRRGINHRGAEDAEGAQRLLGNGEDWVMEGGGSLRD